MIDKSSLNNLFQISVNNSAPHFIVFCDKITPRIEYVCEFIFNNELNCNYSLTSDLKEFNASKNYKINYSKSLINESVNITPQNLLFENSIRNDLKPEFVSKDIMPVCFRSSEEHCEMGFDLFSAVFYFISRYEEWQPFEKDAHGRFELKNSILFKNGLHLKPLLNIWINEFKKRIEQKFPEIKLPQKKFKYISTIDVDNLYAYKHKGAIRTAGAFLKDLARLDLNNFNRRFKTLLGVNKDPFDVYDELIKVSESNQTDLLFFFLLRSGTKYDRTIDPSSGIFRKLFEKTNSLKEISGIHPSYDTVNNENKFKEELFVFKESSGVQAKISRQHFLRFDIKSTPLSLKSKGILADFSMGFASGAGYRAGTSTPFNYYDFNKENSVDLLMVPFAAMDGAYFIYSDTKPEKCEESILSLSEEIRKLNGVFITVFHERTFDDQLYPGFGKVYHNLHQKLKV